MVGKDWGSRSVPRVGIVLSTDAVRRRAAQPATCDHPPVWVIALCLSGGSDGDRLREIDAVAPPLGPFLYPERMLRARHRGGAGRYAAGTIRRAVPQKRWPEVAARAEREGLRAVARDLGVSHETVRTVLRAVGSRDRA